MFSKHVSKELSAYCHGELPADRMRGVAEHLIGCDTCRPEYEEIKLGVKLAEQLPLVSAPETLWADLQIQVDAQSARRAAGSVGAEQRSFKRRFKLWQPRWLAVATVLLLVAGFGLFMIYKREARPFWEVARLDGTPRIGASDIDGKGRLGVGQWLETDSNSRAQIAVGNIGEVEIDPNTRVRLVETKATEHRLELAQGRMSAHIWAPPRLFFVDTPSGVAADLGCAYTLEVDDKGASLLHVTSGWVALQLKDRESMVPAGAACATRPGIGPGTPYFEDASELFRSTLTKLDFDSVAATNPATESKSKALDILLAEARVRDTLTLWHLLARVEGADRAKLYDGMAALVPPPAGVTRAGVLNLNELDLQLWKETMERSWSGESGLRKAWIKVWTRGLGKLHGIEGKS
jgi:hypothetical protein